MKQTILALSATVAALALAPSAQAATTITLLSDGSALTGSFGGSHTTGPFADEYTFTIPANIGTDVLVSTFASLASANVDFNAALSSYDGSSFGSYSGASFAEFLLSVTGPITAGTHSLVVAGNVTGTAGSYSGTLNVYPAPVPEPATWAMMIAGFGLAGVALRRRSTAARNMAVSFV